MLFGSRTPPNVHVERLWDDAFRHIREALELAPLSLRGRFGRRPPEWDVVGWPVVDAAAQRVGRVRDVVVDAATRVPRYLSVALDRRGPRPTPARRVLVPVACATASLDQGRVELPAVSCEALAAAPPFGVLMSPADERTLARHFGVPVPLRPADEAPRATPHAERDRLRARGSDARPVAGTGW